jgi:hypothetical protein
MEHFVNIVFLTIIYTPIESPNCVFGHRNERPRVILLIK